MIIKRGESVTFVDEFNPTVEKELNLDGYSKTTRKKYELAIKRIKNIHKSTNSLVGTVIDRTKVMANIEIKGQCVKVPLRTLKSLEDTTTRRAVTYGTNCSNEQFIQDNTLNKFYLKHYTDIEKLCVLYITNKEEELWKNPHMNKMLYEAIRTMAQNDTGKWLKELSVAEACGFYRNSYEAGIDSAEIIKKKGKKFDIRTKEQKSEQRHQSTHPKTGVTTLKPTKGTAKIAGLATKEDVERWHETNDDLVWSAFDEAGKIVCTLEIPIKHTNIRAKMYSLLGRWKAKESNGLQAAKESSVSLSYTDWVDARDIKLKFVNLENLNTDMVVKPIYDLVNRLICEKFNK